jgi:hypothetical protein
LSGVRRGREQRGKQQDGGHAHGRMRNSIGLQRGMRATGASLRAELSGNYERIMMEQVVCVRSGLGPCIVSGPIIHNIAGIAGRRL